MTRARLLHTLQQGWATHTLNYHLLFLAGVFILIGSVLMWAKVDAVVATGKGHDDAVKAANFEICNFLFIWLCGFVVLLLREIRCGFQTRGPTLLLGGFMVFAIQGSHIASWGCGNLWRLYIQDTTRLSVEPSSSDMRAVQCMLAGFVFCQLGALLTLLAVVYRAELLVHMSFHGWHAAIVSLLFAFPGVLMVWASGLSTLERDTQLPTYALAWGIATTSVAISLLQCVGLLFDTVELVCACMVVCGTYGSSLLGDTFQLLSSSYRQPGGASTSFTGRDRDLACAGGVLCYLSTLCSIYSVYRYFLRSGLQYVYSGHVLLSSPHAISDVVSHPHVAPLLPSEPRPHAQPLNSRPTPPSTAGHPPASAGDAGARASALDTALTSLVRGSRVGPAPLQSQSTDARSD